MKPSKYRPNRLWRERLSTGLFLISLTGMAAWTGWLTLGKAPQLFAAASPKPPSSEPDYIIEQLAATRLSAQGNLAIQLVAPQLSHYAHNDSIQISQPRIVGRSADGTVTAITAKTGQILRNGAQIDLNGQVQLQRVPAEAGAETLKLTTEALTVLPDTEIISSRVPVQGQRGGALIRADSMLLDNKQRSASFVGRITSTIAPNPQAPL